MKVIVVLLGLITATVLTGVAGVTVRIRAYNATGNIIPEHKDAFTLGTRVLLTCDVTELPESSEVSSYRWYHGCTGGDQGRCQIRDRDPYYRVVNDTLLVDVTSQDQGGRYYCFVKFSNMLPQSSHSTSKIAVAGNPIPFLYTPTSLLPEHSVLTDVQQATGRNRQQWITCRSGGQGTRPQILMGSNVVRSSSTANSATIGLDIRRRNGLYLCFISHSQRQHFSLYLKNSVTLSTPTVSDQDTSVWTLASLDGSRVERYIVEFECSVQNITFVEKYMSVSASGGTGRVATSVSCFGGLGQLYRVKVWAVSGPNISRALVCIPDGQCREGDRRTPTTTTPVTPPGNTDSAPPTPSGPQSSSTNHANMQPDGSTMTIQTIGTSPAVGGHATTMRSSSPIPRHDGTRTGVGVGVGVFLLLVLLTVVVLILVVVAVRRKAACKQNTNVKMEDSSHYNNTAVVKEEVDTKEKGLDANYTNVDNAECEEKSSLVDGFDPYEDVDRQPQLKHAKRLAPKESTPTASATNVFAVYATVDKSRKKGAKKETEDGCTVTNKDDLYAMPMKNMGKMTDTEKGVVESGGVEEEEQYDDAVGLRYEPKADRESGQQSEGDNKAPNADVLYAVVDKCRKKRK